MSENVKRCKINIFFLNICQNNNKIVIYTLYLLTNIIFLLLFAYLFSVIFNIFLSNPLFLEKKRLTLQTTNN